MITDEFIVTIVSSFGLRSAYQIGKQLDMAEADLTSGISVVS